MSRRRLAFHLASTVWLTAVWVLLWGDLNAANVLAGVALSALVTWATPMPPVDYRGRVHPLPAAYLVHRFVVDLVVASAQVAALALRPGRAPRPALLRVRLRSHSDLYLTLTAQLCSLVPGSVVVEAHRTTGTLYVHVLDLGIVGGVEAARAHVLDTEARVLRAFASDDELAAAGLPRDPREARPGSRTAEATR